MTATKRPAHIMRAAMFPTRIPHRAGDVDAEPVSETERTALASKDGDFVRWETLKAELRL